MKEGLNPVRAERDVIQPFDVVSTCRCVEAPGIGLGTIHTPGYGSGSNCNSIRPLCIVFFCTVRIPFRVRSAGNKPSLKDPPIKKWMRHRAVKRVDSFMYVTVLRPCRIT
jgi:hypothetical protein